MRARSSRGLARRLAWLPLMGSLARAADIVYVTDLPIFTSLAPCAQSAISYNVMSMTYSLCPESVSDLQSCVCSRASYSSGVLSSISKSVSYTCGSTASSDQNSASTVFSVYCDQAATVQFPTPATPVTQYITDIPEIAFLAPCAASSLSYAVFSMTYEYCPPEASNLATCACQKDQNSLIISQNINEQVREGCESMTVDIASAQAFFAAYCRLNNGTSSFPSATFPPGDMTYYVTDIPEYSGLAPCAQSAVSHAVFSNTYELCPKGPQLLASCACLKESMPSVVSSNIISDISYYCTSDDTDDVTSAMNVYNLYCSAAKKEAVVTGVTTSVVQTRPFGLSGTIPTATATGTVETTVGSTTGGSGGSGGGSSSGGSSGGKSADKSNTSVIVGAVVGVVGGLAVLSFAVFKMFQYARKKERAPAADFQQLHYLNNAGHRPPPDNIGNGKPELGGTPLPPPLPTPSPSPSTNKYHGGAPAVPSPSRSPVPGQSPYSQRAELQGQGSPNGAYLSPSYAELHGQQEVRPELQGNYVGQPGYGQAGPYEAPSQQPIYQADSRPVGAPTSSAPAGGMAFQSGPVPLSYAELEGGSHSNRQQQ